MVSRQSYLHLNINYMKCHALEPEMLIYRLIFIVSSENQMPLTLNPN